MNVLRDIGIAVRQGETVAVLGPNGAGKSTLMRALSGLGRPVEGNILFLGDAVERLDASEITARGLVLVPEGRQVFPELSVVDNILLGAYARPDGETAQRAEQMLDRFPRLRERAGQRAGLLSGGEQQMLAIARGLMARPRVLMLDEPSLGLAPKLVEGLYDLLAELRDEGVTILLVDQAAAMALSVADRAYVLQSGEIVHSGAAADIRSDPALAKAYLGAACITTRREDSMDLILRNARLIGAEQEMTDIGIMGGRIAAIQQQLAAEGETLDLGGRLVSPA